MYAYIDCIDYVLFYNTWIILLYGIYDTQTALHVNRWNERLALDIKSCCAYHYTTVRKV